MIPRTVLRPSETPVPDFSGSAARSAVLPLVRDTHMDGAQDRIADIGMTLIVTLESHRCDERRPPSRGAPTSPASPTSEERGRVRRRQRAHSGGSVASALV